jgi:pheromone a factor receptor
VIRSIRLSSIDSLSVVLSYCSFDRRRAEFQRYLATSEGGLNVNRYLRLMALASIEILLVLPLNLFSIIVNVTANPLLPYTSWNDVHYNFSRVAYITNFLLQVNHKFYVEFTVARWAIPLSGFLFFVFFGLSIEAQKDYRRAIK